jgi:hypothetical protein
VIAADARLAQHTVAITFRKDRNQGLLGKDESFYIFLLRRKEGRITAG